uniref:Metalloendopeptidase n=1 Tax=Globodera rostochiensis TaxID=31243 RepID=A0A914IFE2_GLORO
MVRKKMCISSLISRTLMPRIVMLVVVFCIGILLQNNLVNAGACLSSGDAAHAAQNFCSKFDEKNCSNKKYETKKWIINCEWTKGGYKSLEGFDVVRGCINAQLINGSPIWNEQKSSTDNKIFETAVIESEEQTELKQLLSKIKIAALKNIKKYSDGIPTKSTEDRAKTSDYDDDSILSINDQILGQLFEGDILLSVPQAKQILLEIEYEDHQNKRIPRQADPTPESLWTNLTIPYTFHPDFKNDSKLINVVKIGLSHVESLTCIRFEAYENNTELVESGKDFLEYFRSTGCWSPVGRHGGAQRISIGSGCDRLDIVAHETLHSLAENSDNMGLPYDIGSTMHYPSKGFSKDRKSYTILTKDSNFQQTMGFRGGLSFKDARMINKRYCQKSCQEELECYNHGYTDPNNCLQCRCPEGYSGNFCQETPISNSPNCKNVGFLMAGAWEGSITTGQLYAGSECYWRIIPQLPKQRIEISISKLEFPCTDLCTSYLEVKAKRDKISTGARLCCGSPKTIYGDVDTEIILILKVSENINGTFQGAELDYKTVNASITVPVVTQTLLPTTPIKPENGTAPSSLITPLASIGLANGIN